MKNSNSALFAENYTTDTELGKSIKAKFALEETVSQSVCKNWKDILLCISRQCLCKHQTFENVIEQWYLHKLDNQSSVKWYTINENWPRNAMEMPWLLWQVLSTIKSMDKTMLLVIIGYYWLLIIKIVYLFIWL